MEFKKAIKFEEKLRLCLAGVAGSGKTYSALRIACAIAKACGGRVAMADSENRSARKYADIFDFDTLDLEPPYHPRKIGDAIDSAEKGGYKVLVIDSMSHFWQGKGGLLEEVDKIAKRSSSGNTFTAWKDATPIQVAMIEAMLSSKLHLIVTVRSKMEFVIEQVEGRNGHKRNVPRKIGMSPVQRSDLQYEFDIYGQMTQENDLIIEKTRCSKLAQEVIHCPGEELAQILLEWTKGEAEQPRERGGAQEPDKPQQDSKPAKGADMDPAERAARVCKIFKTMGVLKTDLENKLGEASEAWTDEHYKQLQKWRATINLTSGDERKIIAREIFELSSSEVEG